MNLKLEKEKLIKKLIDLGVLKTAEVTSAFRKVKREDFVPTELREFSYENEPLAIGYGQTISQPLTVIAMTEALNIGKGDIVLEIGSGSGYQSAIISEIVGDKGLVVTIERLRNLYEFSKKNLKNYGNVKVYFGDGTDESLLEEIVKNLRRKMKTPWFDKIIVAAAAQQIPESLVRLLKEGGNMIIPIIDKMILIKKQDDQLIKEGLGSYRFVPLIGKHGHHRT